MTVDIFANVLCIYDVPSPRKSYAVRNDPADNGDVGCRKRRMVLQIPVSRSSVKREK